MASHGINDRVAIVGMGCTPFREHWDLGLDDLLIDAATEAFASAGIDKDDVDAYWLGTAQGGMSGITLARPLQLEGKPVTRVENYCATGSEALRQAAYAVAHRVRTTWRWRSASRRRRTPATRASTRYPAQRRHRPHAHRGGDVLDGGARPTPSKFGVDPDELREAMAHVAWKNHANGARNPRAQFRREVSMETICRVAEGRGHARRVRLRRRGRRRRRRDRVPRRGRPPLHRQADLREGAVVRRRQRRRAHRPVLRLHHVPRGRRRRARDAYAQAGITDPRAEIALAEVHDCFTITELVLMEDLGFSERGAAWRDVIDGVYDLDGELPVNPDGGLKSFGHPVGASGLRMMFEAWLQLRGEAPRERASTPPGRAVARASPTTSAATPARW